MNNVFKKSKNKSLILLKKITFGIACLLVSLNIFSVEALASSSISTSASVVIPSSGGGVSLWYSSPPIIPPIIKKGDANRDNKIDKNDFALMVANWGKTGNNICDFNSDGKVDKYDFALLMFNWGK